MSEHPLLFTVEMVKAVLDGRKTQTRRVPIERYRNWKVGDTIWVREKMYTLEEEALYYSADNDVRYPETGVERNWIWKRKVNTTIPSIHMPRWAARIFLEITGLRVESMQDISKEDAWDEGCPNPSPMDSRDWFKALWDSINAKRHKGIYAWDKNPGVKVIEFKIINAKAGNK